MMARNQHSFSFKMATRPTLTIALVTVMLFVFGCGGDSTTATNTSNYPVGISENVEQQLKYDSRVDSFDTGQGDSLIVNVNESWVSSPPGMQERSLGQWYSLWHSDHSGGVVVLYQGNKIASWTSTDGYKPEPKSKGERPASEG